MSLLNSHSRLRRSERGGTLVEFALIMPVVALILVGILEFGMVMYEKNSVVEASRDSVRQAAVNADEGDVGACGAGDDDYNWLKAACLVAPAGSEICIEYGAKSEPVTVTVRLEHFWITPLAAQIAGSSSRMLEGSNTMRLEQNPDNLPGSGTCVVKP
jgi:Flp pilus assembly pilin Flp